MFELNQDQLDRLNDVSEKAFVRRLIVEYSQHQSVSLEEAGMIIGDQLQIANKFGFSSYAEQERFIRLFFVSGIWGWSDASLGIHRCEDTRKSKAPTSARLDLSERVIREEGSKCWRFPIHNLMGERLIKMESHQKTV